MNVNATTTTDATTAEPDDNNICETDEEPDGSCTTCRAESSPSTTQSTFQIKSGLFDFHLINRAGSGFSI